MHLAFVSVTYERNRPVSARLTIGLALRVDANGVVVEAHRADAYRSDEFEREPHHERRNEAVRWQPVGKDLVSLERTVGCDIESRSPPG